MDAYPVFAAPKPRSDSSIGSSVQLGSQFLDEAEVIGGGIIPLESAVWIWWPGPEDPGYFDEENSEDPGYDRKGKATSRHWKNIGQALLTASENV